MCGIVGIVTQAEGAAVPLYEGLSMIQHRGQDAAGIATADGKQLNLRKDNGLLRDVFKDHHMERLTGNMGIGHVRYPTAGSGCSFQAQPFYVNSPYGLVLAHNGNLINSDELGEELQHTDLRHLNTDSDSEVLLNIFAHELAEFGKVQLNKNDIFAALTRVNQRIKGAYAVVAMIVGHGIVAFRDPHGIRPLIYGKRQTPAGTEYMVASESVALSALGFTPVRDVKPGEAIFIDLKGDVHSHQCSESAALHPCIFEYVYFARPDSMIDGISVYKARLRMGDYLAKKILAEHPDHDIDVVMPIPDTSRTSALPIAHMLGVKYREGFIKNRYIGRTFIMPGQAIRQKSVRQKLNPIPLEFAGKNVLLVDDSIVRGTTSRQIVQMARESGAKNVYMASAAPPIRYPNVYGIDMPAPNELIAHNRTIEQISAEIGTDWLIYQDLDDLMKSVCATSPKVDLCEASCFDAKYLTGGVDEQYLQMIEAKRSDQALGSQENLILNLNYDIRESSGN
jgi:amidophosphoribosyltransferase